MSKQIRTIEVRISTENGFSERYAERLKETFSNPSLVPIKTSKVCPMRNNEGESIYVTFIEIEDPDHPSSPELSGGCMGDPDID